MDQPYRLHIAVAAQEDLEAAVDWIKQDSDEAAFRFFTRFRNRCETNLTSTPSMGVPLTLVDGTALLALTCGQYRVFYQVDETSRMVTLIRILHTSRDIRSILNDEDQ